MKYILCHKNVKVLDFEIINDDIYNIYTVYNEEHLPLFLKQNNDKNKIFAFKQWWKGRCIPSSRQNLDSFLEKTKFNDVKSLVIKSMGLSLSDQYWIKPDNSSLQWEDINFYENDFSSDVGDLFFGIKLNKEINFISPDNTSDGWLLKKWIIKNGQRFLIKGGSEPYEQEPFNEVLASKICECLNIPHAEYTLVKIGDNYFSSCNNITDKDTELISAWNVLNTKRKDRESSSFSNLLKCCFDLKIDCEENLNNAIGKMILLDYIIANTDRHFNNFSFIRNSNTLEWKGFAPIFDNGTSMFNKIPTSYLKKQYYTDSKNINAKPFYTKQQKQLEKFADIIAVQNIDFDVLKDIPSFFSELLSQNNRITVERNSMLTEQLKRRIEHSRSVIYRKNNITKEFLKKIFEDKSQKTDLEKISSAFTKITSANPTNKRIIDNYLKLLNSKDETEMEQFILKDIDYFFCKKQKSQHPSRSE